MTVENVEMTVSVGGWGHCRSVDLQVVGSIRCRSWVVTTADHGYKYEHWSLWIYNNIVN
jgi:hypothetical protein